MHTSQWLWGEVSNWHIILVHEIGDAQEMIFETFGLLLDQYRVNSHLPIAFLASSALARLALHGNNISPKLFFRLLSQSVAMGMHAANYASLSHASASNQRYYLNQGMAGMMCDLASGGSANQLDASKALYALSSSSTFSNLEFCFCYIITTHSVLLTTFEFRKCLWWMQEPVLLICTCFAYFFSLNSTSLRLSLYIQLPSWPDPVNFSLSLPFHVVIIIS